MIDILHYVCLVAHLIPVIIVPFLLSRILQQKYSYNFIDYYSNVVHPLYH